MTLLQMSISATILIIIITVLRAILIHKLPKKTLMFLWGLALFRLLIPISIPSVFSVYSLIPQNNTSYVSEPINDLPRFFVTSDMVSENITNNVDAQGIYNVSISLWTVLWMIGFSLCVLYFLIAYHRGIKKFKNALPLETTFIKEWKEKHPLKRTLLIQSSDQVFSPLSYGIFKPVILLPSTLDFENTEVLNYIMTHEYVHIKHFDILTKMLMILALSIHWFNPMVWVMYLLLNRDIELVCDETVVKLFGEKNKKSYAHILIDMEIQKSGLMPLCNNFSRNSIEERIGVIMKMKKMTIFSSVLAGLLVVGVTMAFATSGQTEDGRTLAKQEQMNGTHSQSYENMSPLSLSIKLQNGEEKEFGPFEKVDEMLEVVKPFCEKQVNDGNMKQSEYEEILSKYSSVSSENQSNIDNYSDSLSSENQSSTEGEVLTVGEQAYEQGNALTPDELEKLYSVYSSFGLNYDKNKDCFYYKGKLVREFIDVMQSNGESLSSGKFKGTIRQISNPRGEGEIDVSTIRDYEKKDEFGNGTLLEIKEQ